MNALREFRDFTIKPKVYESSRIFGKLERNTYINITFVFFRNRPCLTMYNMSKA